MAKNAWHTYRGDVAAIADFDKRHGGRSVLRDGFYYYPSGAVRASGQWGRLQDPPDDPRERQQAVVRFYRVACERSEKQFEYFRENYAEYNYEDEETITTLKELQQQVLEFRKGLEEAEWELLRIEYGVTTVAEARKLKAEHDERAAQATAKRTSDKTRARRRMESILI